MAFLELLTIASSVIYEPPTRILPPPLPPSMRFQLRKISSIDPVIHRSITSNAPSVRRCATVMTIRSKLSPPALSSPWKPTTAEVEVSPWCVVTRRIEMIRAATYRQCNNNFLWLKTHYTDILASKQWQLAVNKCGLMIIHRNQELGRDGTESLTFSLALTVRSRCLIIWSRSFLRLSIFILALI